MPESFTSLVVDALGQYWLEAVASISLMTAGWWAGRRRARREWERLEFLGRLNVSLNRIQDGTLEIRTILEKPLSEVFSNPSAVDKVQRSALRTSEANPLLVLDKRDRWPILNCVLNEVSERFADGHLRRDLGYPVVSDSYLMCLTRERAEDLRTNKIRAMLIKKSLLLALPSKEPGYEHPVHRIRFQTLTRLRELHAEEPDSFVELQLAF
jgi:hypothetical protein